MNNLILWLHNNPITVYSTLLSLIFYCWKTLPKKKIIRAAAEPLALGDSFDSMAAMPQIKIKGEM